MMVLITGGSGSGKSEIAENIAVTLHSKADSKKLYYLATMLPYGREAGERIKKHRKMRSFKGFSTREVYYDLADFAEENIKGSTCLLECLGNLTANEMFEKGEKNCSDKIYKGLLLLSEKAENLVVVTNDVFCSGAAYSKETLDYMAQLGKLNRTAALAADIVIQAQCGLPVFFKGENKKNEIMA